MKTIIQLLKKFQVTIILICIAAQLTSAQSNGTMVTLNSIGIKVKQLPGWTVESSDAYIFYRSPYNDMVIVIMSDPSNTMQYYSEILPYGVEMGGGETVHAIDEIQTINNSSSYVKVSYANAYESVTAWVGMKQTLWHGVVAFLAFTDGRTPLPDAKSKMLEVLASCTEISSSETAVANGSFGKYTSPVLQQWHQELVHSRLSYFHTYNSGGGDGMSSKRTIDLCRSGDFVKQYEGSINIDVPGASGYNGSEDVTYGKWSLRLQNNRPVLVLTPQQGNVMEYWLTYEDGKLYLDNDRYYLVNDNSENGPHCD